MQNGRIEAGVWCSLGEVRTAAATARAGFDWTCLDAQHGAFGRSEIVATLAALPGARVLVRTPSLDAAFIGAALDAGATGVIVPLVSTVEAAQAAVAAALYPPLGGRSWGPMTPLWGGAAVPPDDANRATEVWVMIETPAALAAVDEILAVPGITGVFVGPFDLSIGLGVTLDALLAADGEGDPLPTILRAAARAGIRAGAFGGEPERAARLGEIGFDLLAVTTDAAALAAGAAAALGTVAGPSAY